jgi:glycine cleavage system transcriptional repressor
MNQCLSISILYKNNPDLLTDVMHLIEKLQCRAEACHSLDLGSHTNLAIFVSGNWDSIAKLETNIGTFSKKKDTFVQLMRSELIETDHALLPYSVEVITALSPTGIVAEMSAFFRQQGAPIEELSIETYPSRHKILLSYILMRICIPADLELSELREQFIILCDDLNIDAALEPERD